MKIYINLMVFLLAIMISVPALAAKPPTTIYLAGGPIPINSGSSTQYFSCNVANHGGTAIFDFSMRLCGIEVDGSLDCGDPLPSILGSGTALEGLTTDFDGIMMTCEISYEGQPGDVTGTACMSDANVGQACVPLQEVEPTIKIIR